MAAVQDIRDIVLIILGIVWSLVYLGVLAVAVVAGVLLVRYLGKAQALIEQQGGALLDQVQMTVEGMRGRTAALPHYGAGEEGDRRRPIEAPRVPRPQQVGLKLSLPFFRRKKPWYQRLLGR